MDDIQNGNYIRIYRKIMRWEWYTNGNTMRVFFHLLLNANWKDGRYRGYEIPRGSLVVGRKKLAKELKMSEQSVRTALEHLKSTNEITTKTTNRFTIVTLVNYDNYQVIGNDGNHQTNQQPNQQSTNNQPTTNHNRINKEYKESNKENIYSGESEHAFGIRGNVYLTMDEVEELKKLYPDRYKDMIDDFSLYKSSSGKAYKNDFDTMIRYERNKNPNTKIIELDFLNTDWHEWDLPQWSKAIKAGKATNDDFRRIRNEVVNGTV